MDVKCVQNIDHFVKVKINGVQVSTHPIFTTIGHGENDTLATTVWRLW